VYKPEKCYNGFTLVSSGLWWNLIDMKGRTVHRWYGDPVIKRGSQLFERLSNGNYVSNGIHVTEQDWNGDVLWHLPFERKDRPLSSMYHHDVQRLPNGNYIVMVREYVSDPKISKVKLQDDHLMEISPEKKIVWEWWGHEHFDEFEFTDEAKKIIYETGGGEVGAFPPPHEEWFLGDWLHINTIHVSPENPLYKEGDSRFKPGNLLLCSRNTNMIFIIDKKTGSIVWKWGALLKMRGFWILGVGDTRHCLVGPHDPKMLDNGNILIYDNGGSGGYPPIVRFYTRLVEINPVSGEIIWEYIYRPSPRRFLSITTGGVQRLPNGNTLSLDSNQGRVFEITPQGEIVWEYVNPRGFYRTQRISYEDCPQANPYYMETDGHLGVKPAEITIPERMGLPVRDGCDYCPRFYIEN